MLHHRPAEVRLTYNGIGFVPVVGVRCNLAPRRGPSLHGQIRTKVGITIHAEACNNDPDRVVVRVVRIVCARRIDSHNDPHHVRQYAIGDAPPLDMLFREQLVWRCICKLSV